MTGRIDLTGISVALAAHADGSLSAVAVGMVLAAFGFKAAVAPDADSSGQRGVATWKR